MSHTKKLALLALAIAVLISGTAFAVMHEDKDDKMMEKESQRQKMGKEYQKGQMGQELMQANNVLGSDVSNQQGEELGTITEIVIDPVQDQVAYAVLSAGGEMGMGEKLIAVPFNELNIQQDKVMLDISKNQIQKAQGFTRDNWPNEAKQQWQQIKSGAERMTQQQQETQRMQQQQAMEEQQRQQTTQRDTQRQQQPQARQQQPGQQQEQFRMIKASQIIGLAVQNTQGEDISDIEDLCIQKQGQVEFAILSYGGFFGIDEKLVAVPWESLGFKAEPSRVAVLDADQETLDQFAFEEGQMPDLTDSQYTQRLEQEFGERSATQILGYMPSREQELTNEAWKQDSKYNQNFKPDNIKSVQVTVKSVGTFYPDKNATEGVRLKVEDQQGKSHTVYTGPKAFHEKNNVKIQQGDELQIKGSQTEVGWREVIIATEIKKDGKTIQLRNEQGDPQWKASELDQMQKEKQQKQQEGYQRQRQQMRQQQGQEQSGQEY